MMNSWLNKNFKILLLIGIAANALGLCNQIVEPDGALYASIAKHIADSNNWLYLFGDGRDWLDKPHFPFWITAISYKIFGINAFAYKLPSFLCFLIGTYYTYKLSQKIFNTSIAQLSTIIYITTLHVVVCNYDVRAEGYLTCFIIATIYYLHAALYSHKWVKPITIAAFYTALALMTKGIFIYITIGSGFVIYWLFTKQYTQFLQLKWYTFVALSLIFIAPEIYSLYIQFDSHPEKIVFHTTNVSGIKFFFWDSQFGRFFNNGPIKGEGDILFFVHTMLWAFLPYSIYLIIAMFSNVKWLKGITNKEAIIIYSSALCSFILFSVSKFQLPHYIVIVFPQMAMLVANYIYHLQEKKGIVIAKNIQAITFIIIVFVISVVGYLYKLNYAFTVIILLVLAVIFFIKYYKNHMQNILLLAVLNSVVIAIFLNLIFYPQVMYYESGMTAGQWQKKHLPNTYISMYRCNDNMLEIYGNTYITRDSTIEQVLKNNSDKLIYTYQTEMKKIDTNSFTVKPLQYFSYYPITLLSKDFIDKSTRYKTLDTFVIAQIEPIKK